MPTYEYACHACGRDSEIWFRSFAQAEQEAPQCEHCGSTALKRLISRPGLIRSTPSSQPGTLRRVDPRKAVEQVSRQYDQAGVDPGRGFEEVARRAAAGDSPETLKEVVNEARKNEAQASSSSSSKGDRP